MKTPLTPQQAVNNFRLFLELSPRNSYEDYRAAVRELAEICIDHGIKGDDNHPSTAPSLLEALELAQATIERLTVKHGPFRVVP